MSSPTEQPGNSIAHDAAHDLLHFDRKIFRTLPVLLLKPGFLTKRSLEGDQGRFVKPFALFVFLNFIFFLVKSKGIFNYTLEGYSPRFDQFILQKQKVLGLTTELLTERFNTAMHFEEKEYLVLMIPLFALVLQLLFWGKKRPFATHLIFSLHFYSFFILLLILLPLIFVPLQWLTYLFFPGTDLLHSEMIFGSSLVGASFIYLSLAVKTVYNGHRYINLVKSLFLSAAVIGLIVFVYRTIIFFIVLHSISE